MEKKSIEELRAELLQVEAEIKRIVGKEPGQFYIKFPSEEDVERIDELIGDRKYILDRMFSYTSEEIKRIEEVNDLLVKLRKQMYSRTANLYRTLLKYGQDKDFDDDYDIDGSLDVDVDYDSEEGDFGTVLHLDNDDYYGSDFSYMIFVAHENAQVHWGSLEHIEDLPVFHCKWNTPDMSDEELGCNYSFLDDGTSWDECLHRPDLAHICFGHGFHSILTHNDYSLPDILRINRYEVNAKIVCQRITDQKGGNGKIFETI